MGQPGACGQEVTFVVHDDEAVGLNGLAVEFDDERVVPTRGSRWSRCLLGGLGSSGWPGGWCGCVAIGRVLPMPGAR